VPPILITTNQDSRYSKRATAIRTAKSIEVAALLLSVRQHVAFKSSPDLRSEQADTFVLFTESFDAERCKYFLVYAKVMESGRREEL